MADIDAAQAKSKDADLAISNGSKPSKMAGVGIAPEMVQVRAISEH